MGRGVFTKVSISISAGDSHTILSALPIAHCSVEEARGALCEHCFYRSESPLKKCSRCKFVYYCNTECQCKIVRGVKEVAPAPFIRLALRALAIDTQHLCSLPSDWYSSREQLAAQLLITDTAYLCNHPRDVIHQLFRKLVCNQFSVTAGDEMSPVGVALYTTPSLLNHSCRPNTLALFNGRQILFKAVRDINPGEQLFISYTDTVQLLSERQTDLQKGYNFTCACERCLEDISKSPGCSDRLLLMDANGKEVPCSLRQDMEKKLEELNGLKKRGEWQVMYDKGRALYTRHLTQLSPDNILGLRLMYHLIRAGLELCLWEEALEYSIKLLESSLRQFGPFNPMSVVHLLRTGKLRRCLGTTDQLILSLADFTKAKTAALNLYGADHFFTLRAAELLTHSQLELDIAHMCIQ
ncbi:histone-lysine N-methyltransferase SMYD3-like [Halichondria panicea]|uniref:histone-lysine N-methyltransferase SMYD3-like n=1 Tax=Halichondria panicea TaxID=6063 RepID=UPI00312B957E